MAPLSILPGRVRFETRSVIGYLDRAISIKEQIQAVKGVSEVSVSHRTGRILVVFDDNAFTRKEIEQRIEAAVQTAVGNFSKTTIAYSAQRKTASESNFQAGQFVLDMALHALIPAPLDFFLPVAANVFRKKSSSITF